MVVIVTRAYPWVVGGLLLCLSGIGFWLDSGHPQLTVPQQIVKYAKPGGAAHWTILENGAGGGIFSAGYGNKKEEADYLQALRFCNAHKGLDGCTKVTATANNDFGL